MSGQPPLTRRLTVHLERGERFRIAAARQHTLTAESRRAVHSKLLHAPDIRPEVVAMQAAEPAGSAAATPARS